MTWFDTKAWPWDPHFHSLDDGRLHYVDVGDGPPVLLSHGTPTWAFEWRHLIRALAPTHRLIAPDHLGFGLSDRPADASYTPEAHAARFRAFADALDLRDVTVVLHDFGGPIGLDWVLDNPDRLARVVIVNTFGWPLEGLGRYYWPSTLMGTAFGRYLYRDWNVSLKVLAPSAWADRSRWDAIAANYLGAFEDPDDRALVLWPLAKALVGSSAYYATLEQRMDRLADVPVDVIWGTADSAFTLVERDRWLQLLPHATSHALADAGHWPHEEQPEAFLEALGQ